MSNTRIFLSGCMGRMGRVITEMCAEYDDTTIVAGSDVVSNPQSSFPIYSDPTRTARSSPSPITTTPTR